MEGLYKFIDSLIDSICSDYSDHYPENEEKKYPYAEVKISNAIPNNSFSDNYPLSITIWHNKGTDIREIEGIADAIHKKLNRMQYNDSAMNVSINRNVPFRLSIPDVVPHIQRRELRYIMTVYFK